MYTLKAMRYLKYVLKAGACSNLSLRMWAQRIQERNTSNLSASQEYVDIFKPLMLEECCALLGRGKVEAEEMPSPCQCVTGPCSQVSC